jgi:hypothetical protein
VGVKFPALLDYANIGFVEELFLVASDMEASAAFLR